MKGKRQAYPAGLARAAVLAGVAIGHATDDRDIYEAVCDHLAGDTGIALAWIGLAEPVHRTLRVHASAGEGRGFLADVGMTRRMTAAATGPIETAISSGAPSVVDDLAATTGPEAAAAARHGLRSMAVVPLATGHVVLGVLACYSTEPRFFEEDALEILVAVANQSTSRLAAVEKETAHHEAQSALAAGEERYRGLFEAAPLGILVLRRGRVEANDALLAMFGYPDQRSLEEAGPLAIVAPEARSSIERLISDGLAGDSAPGILQVNGLRRDGSTFPLLVEGVQIEVDGTPGAIVFLTDLGPMEAVEGVAQAARGQYRSLVGGAPLPIVSMDVDGTVRSWNPAAEQVFGWSAAEVIGRTLPGGLSAADHARLRKVARGEATSQPFETRVKRRDDSPVDLRLWVSPNRGRDGKVVGVLVIAEDVTARRVERAALEETQARLRFLFDNMQEGVSYHRMIWEEGRPVDYEYLATNSAFETQTGLHDVVGKRVSEVVPGLMELDPELLEAYGRVAAGGPSVKIRNFVQPLNMWFSISAFCPQPGYFATVFDNITEQVRAEKALQSTNALLERTESLSRVGSWRLELATGKVDWSAELFEIVGLDPSDTDLAPDAMLIRIVHPDDTERAASYFAGLVAGQSGAVDVRIVRPDGRQLTIHIEAEQELDEQGRPVAFVGFAQDITERVEAERTIQEKQTLLDSVLNATVDAIYAKDTEGRYIVANDEVLRVAGRTSEEVLGHDDTEVFEPVAGREVMDRDRAVMESGRTATFEEHLPDGGSGAGRWFHSTKGPLVGPDGSIVGMYGVSRDITERKRRELIAEARVRLLEFAVGHSLDELLEETLNEAENLTRSRIGFFHFVDDDERHLTLHAWSTRTKAEYCTAAGAGSHYPVDEAGVWVDCVRQQRPVIHNDYASLAGRKGMPEGHAAVVREAVVPVFRSGRIRAIVGVGNKETDYTEDDVAAVAQLADLAFDIAGRLRAEDELRVSEEWHRTLLEKAPIAIGAHRHGRGLFANEAHRKMFGYATPEALSDLGPADMIAPESLPEVMDRMARRERGEPVPDEYEILGRHGDGSTFPMLLRAAPINLPDGPATIMFHLDLTEMKRAGEAIRVSEEKFSRMFHAAPMIIALTDAETGAVLDLNKEAADLAGYSRAEALGHSVVELGWQTREQFEQIAAKLRAEGRIEGLEVRRRRRDGSALDALYYGESLVISGRPCILSMMVDITERKKLDKELAEARALRDAVVDSTSDWIWSVDSESFALTSFNSGMADHLRWDHHLEPAVGMSPEQLFGPRSGFWQDLYARALANGRAQIEFDTHDGRSLAINMNVLRRADATFGISAFARDVTEARQATAALRESEARFRAVSENSLSGITIADADGYVYVNPAFAAIFGYEAAEMVGRQPYDFVHPDEVPGTKARMRKRLEGEIDTSYFEFRGVTRDGQVKHLFGLGSRAQLDGRSVLITNVLDVTERERFERDLAEARALSEAVLDSTDDWIWSVESEHFACLTFNAGLAEHIRTTFGLELAPGMTPDQVIPNEDQRRLWLALYERVLRDGAFQVEFEPTPGRFVLLNLHVLKRGDEVFGISGFGRDVSQARRDMAAIQASEEKFARAFEAAPVLMALTDIDTGAFIDANSEALRVSGFERDEIIGHDPVDLGWITAEAQQDLSAAIASAGGVRGREVTSWAKGGRPVRLLVNAERVVVSGRECVLTAGLDVTEHKKAEAALSESEARFRAVSENALSGIAIVDGGRFAYVNPAYARTFGYEPDELVGRELVEVIWPDDRAAAVEGMVERLAAEDATLQMEFRGLRKDGSENDVLVLGSSAELDGRRVVIGSVLDMTERKRLEIDLRHSQKMEAVGRLAGGIAHDFNNLLTAIGGYAHLLESDLVSGVGRPEDAAAIAEAADRAAVLTSRLLTFSGRRAVREVATTLDATVRQILPILRRLVPERVEFVIDTRLTPPLLADTTDLDQVVMNLVVNAADAIDGPGRITIATAAAEHDAEFVAGHAGSRPGPHARLIVSDNGCGMDEATMARIFEPFFTTKGVGSGTGLGLSTVYAVVRQLGGTIDVSSVPGRGTTFEIDLPASAEAAPVETEESVEVAGGSERILLVEDDPSVREFAVSALRRLGYRVMAVESPADALQVAVSGFDLVLSDVVMPGMDGPALVERLRARRPQLRSLMMSGYVPDALQTPDGPAAVGDGGAGPDAEAAGDKGDSEPSGRRKTGAGSRPGRRKLDRETPLLAKPFSPAQLAAAVRAVLDEPRR